MRNQRFDDLARSLALSSSRRSVLKALVGGLFALLATPARAANLPCWFGAPCRTDLDCCGLPCITGRCRIPGLFCDETHPCPRGECCGFLCRNACPPGQVRNPRTCACECPLMICLGNRVFNSATCTCECRPTVCAGPRVFNPATCDCDCPLCPGNRVANPVTCACECPPIICLGHRVFNPATCACDCGIGGCFRAVFDPVTCACGCSIGGVFYPAGHLKPGNACQACQPAVSSTTWTNRADGASCEDGDACTTNDTCRSGLCIGGSAPNCDDGNECTTDTCLPAVGCVHTPRGGPCQNSTGTCVNGTCAPCDGPVCGTPPGGYGCCRGGFCTSSGDGCCHVHPDGTATCRIP
jgi:hypothetical protein